MSAAKVISLIGLPGAGKTTLGKALTIHLGQRCTYFGVGEALRESAAADPSLREQLAAGQLGPEDIVLSRVGALFAACTSEFLILDGFPRHSAQAWFAKKKFTVWKVIHIDVTADTALARLSTRRCCVRCGNFARTPRLSDTCRHCGGLVWKIRDEDSEVTARIRVAHAEAGLLGVLETIRDSVSLARLDGSAPECAGLDSLVRAIL